MKRIVLPTDFSKNAFNAITYALKLFKDIECTFFLLNTYTPPVYHTEYVTGSAGLMGLGDVLQEASINQLEKIKKKFWSKFQIVQSNVHKNTT